MAQELAISAPSLLPGPTLSAFSVRFYDDILDVFVFASPCEVG